MRKSTKEKIFRKVQRLIQGTYMELFFTSSMFLLFFKKFGTWYELKYVVAVAIVTGILTILKAKTFLRKRSNRRWLVKEIGETLRSEKGINF